MRFVIGNLFDEVGNTVIQQCSKRGFEADITEHLDLAKLNQNNLPCPDSTKPC
jgi:hypothetical protein